MRSAIRVRTAVVLVYHAKSVLRKDSPSSITPELRSRRILCRLLVQQYLVRTSTRYQYIFMSGMHKSRRVSSTAVHQQPCRVSDRQYEYVTVVYLSCDEGVVLLLSLQCRTGTRRIILLILNEMLEGCANDVVIVIFSHPKSRALCCCRSRNYY